MRYSKPYLSIDEQIDLLKQRGLEIDMPDASNYLRTIGFFRLSSYLHPLLEHPKENNIFKKGAKFSQAVYLYRFDRKLRFLLFSQIDKIEVATRALMIEKGVPFTKDDYWLIDEKYYSDKELFKQSIGLLKKEWRLSKEDFAVKYKMKYEDYPPSWVLIELVSMGILSNLYINLNSDVLKKQIAGEFGLPSVVFESWLFSLSGIRNICCHHARLWNRTIPNAPILLTNPRSAWIDISQTDTRKLYYKIAMIKYILAYINPHNFLKDRLIALQKEFSTVDFGMMGFPENWLKEPLWHK